jgi:hypothetical protein
MRDAHAASGLRGALRVIPGTAASVPELLGVARIERSENLEGRHGSGPRVDHLADRQIVGFQAAGTSR